MRVNYCHILNLEKVGFYYLGNLPRYWFITLAPGLCYKNMKIVNDYCHDRRVCHKSSLRAYLTAN
jgi:hypothetical protein